MQMKTKTHTALLTVMCLLGFLVIFNNHIFANPEKSPVEIIRARNQAVDDILNGTEDNVSAEKKEQLKEVINGILDFKELSRLALGKHWKDRSDQEKIDFVSVFSQLIKNSSVKKLEVYKADSLVYEKPEINGVKAKVTTIAYKKRKQIEIVYKMHKINALWFVYDMEIDGVSTVRNYRDSFYKKIAKSSYEEMYDALVKKLAKQ